MGCLIVAPSLLGPFLHVSTFDAVDDIRDHTHPAFHSLSLRTDTLDFCNELEITEMQEIWSYSATSVNASPSWSNTTPQHFSFILTWAAPTSWHLARTIFAGWWRSVIKESNSSDSNLAWELRSQTELLLNPPTIDIFWNISRQTGERCINTLKTWVKRVLCVFMRGQVEVKSWTWCLEKERLCRVQKLQKRASWWRSGRMWSTELLTVTNGWRRWRRCCPHYCCSPDESSLGSFCATVRCFPFARWTNGVWKVLGSRHPVAEYMSFPSDSVPFSDERMKKSGDYRAISEKELASEQTETSRMAWRRVQKRGHRKTELCKAAFVPDFTRSNFSLNIHPWLTVKSCSRSRRRDGVGWGTVVEGQQTDEG